MDYQSVLNAVESWPVGERVRLVQDLWDRLADDDYKLELTDEMKGELDRRVNEMDRNPEAGVPWDEARARILGRLGK